MRSLYRPLYLALSGVCNTESTAVAVGSVFSDLQKLFDLRVFCIPPLDFFKTVYTGDIEMDLFYFLVMDSFLDETSK